MNYKEILDFDYNNGDGIRVSLWTTGCPHRCKGCHNEELWDKTVGKPFTRTTLDNLIELLGKDMMKDFSILGGEPLADYNVGVVTTICKEVRRVYPNINIWLWTGFDYQDVQHYEVMKYINTLVDGKFEEGKADSALLWRGSSNQRIIHLNK